MPHYKQGNSKIKQLQILAGRYVHASYDEQIDINMKADNILCEMISPDIEARLEHGLNRGRHGWFSDGVCSIAMLKHLLKDNIEAGDMVSVATIAAMIHLREAMIEHS